MANHKYKFSTSSKDMLPKVNDIRKSNPSALKLSRPMSGRTLAALWREALACEARNSLQVILSGAEILLEDYGGSLQTEQRTLLSKMTENAYHLCNLTASLLASAEFKHESANRDDPARMRRFRKKTV
jgi:hypothetical protein